MKTLQKVREHFYWSKSKEDIEKWYQTCDGCAACKGPKKRSRGRLHRYNIVAPFEQIALDILGSLPGSLNVSKYILVVMDYFTKWPEAYPMPDQEATTIAEVLIQQWVLRFGTPFQIHSDQGTNFTSALFKRLMSNAQQRQDPNDAFAPTVRQHGRDV